jgi:hypothetical protein
MSEWDRAAETRAVKIESLRGFIPGYDYSGEDMAHRTDETFCSLMVENLRVSKKVMFNILETAFELHQDILLKGFEGIRDEIDVFSDEIKVRAFKWDSGKSHKWLERLVDYDYRILSSLGNLIKGIEGLHRELLSSGKGTRELRALDERTVRLKKELDEIVILFKEREAVCNIKDAALEKTFDSIRTGIRKGFDS